MREVIVSGVFAIVFTLLALLFKRTGDNGQEAKQALAKITNLSDHDGKVNYYVILEENGCVLNGKSISYHSSDKSYQVGDIVPITYYFTQNEWVRVAIQDNDLTPSRNSVRILYKILLVVAIVLYIVAIRLGIGLFI